MPTYRASRDVEGSDGPEHAGYQTNTVIIRKGNRLEFPDGHGRQNIEARDPRSGNTYYVDLDGFEES